MARLFVLRHAKAEPAGTGQEDHERPLAARGVTDAEAVGRYMAEREYIPARCLCSTATRTRQTFEQLCRGLGEDVPVTFSESLYHASPMDMLRVIHEHGGKGDLLVVGHNPGIHMFCMQLDDGGNPSSARELAAGFPTTGLAVFACEGAWSALERGRLGAWMAP